jgi:hypothetical protein
MNMQRPFEDSLLPSFYKRELSISTQSVENLWPQVDGRCQAWNAGQLVGLDGLASLAPLGLYIAATGAWLAWTMRRRANTTADSGSMG